MRRPVCAGRIGRLLVAKAQRARRLAALADNECHGSMAVYLRLKGIVPPSSERMRPR